MRRPAVRDWRRAGVVVLVAAPLVAAVVAGQGNPLESFAQDGGGAWVVSPSQGLVTLIDGPSEELVASVRVPGSENGLTVTQAESSAYVADQTAGTVTHVDGATYDVSAPVLLGSPGAALHVLQGGGEVVVVDSGRPSESTPAPWPCWTRSRSPRLPVPGSPSSTPTAGCGWWTRSAAA